MVDELNVVLYGNCSDLWLREAIALALHHHSWQMYTEAASFIDHTFDCYCSTHLPNPLLSTAARGNSVATSATISILLVRHASGAMVSTTRRTIFPLSAGSQRHLTNVSEPAQDSC